MSLPPKFLMFYGTTLLVVVLLFRFTSAYGEANLKAPPNLNGRYLTTTAPPNCPADDRLMITIQQSGLYLQSSLDLITTRSTNLVLLPHHSDHSLEGRWQENMQLSGATTAFTGCQIPSPTAITLQATVQPTPPQSRLELTGQLTVNGSLWQFSAIQQAEATPNPH